MRTFRSLGIASVLLTFAALAWAQEPTESGNRWQWTGKLAPDQVVVVRDINGDIDATGSSSSDQVEVTAEKTGRDADQVKIHLQKVRDGVVICAVYPGMFSSSSEGDCESTSHFGNHHNNARVDFTVRMPQNLRFTGKNVNGAVRAESMGRYVDAESVNGEIHVQTQSWASAESVNGSIDARLGRTDWPGELDFKTVNGSIKLEMPSNLNAEVDFKSVNGHLESDFPLTVQGSMGKHVLHGTIGNGGRELNVKTVNGSVELRKAGV
jgi:hypothetical protein